MKLLLDTHTLLWFMHNDSRLSARVGDLILDRANDLAVSVASLWEIGIKTSLGKLELAETWVEDIEAELRRNGVGLCPIEMAHCKRVSRLPFHHRDPFDRLLVAQAQESRRAIVSKDVQFDNYGVRRIW